MRSSPLFKKINNLIFTNETENKVYKFLFIKKNKKEHANKVILIQGVQSLYYFGLFGLVVGKLREHNDVLIEVFHLKSITPAFKSNLLNFVRLVMVNFLENHKWSFLYGSYSDRIAYKSAEFSLFYDPIDFFRSIKIWKKLSSKEALLNLKIFEVPIGDLVYDTYLRYKPSPTVDLKDPYLILIIWQAFRDLRKSQKYFSSIKPAMYLTSYSTYVEHGIAIRVALNYGIKVFSIIFYLKFWKELTSQDMSVIKNGEYYALEFKELREPEALLAKAEKAIIYRLNGGVDASNSYMRNVPKISYKNFDDEIYGSVIIFLHDFFDSPHSFKGNIFCDFYEWVVYTIEFLKAQGIKFCVKPHPNQIDANLTVIESLKALYPDVVFIPNDISNSYMVQAGIVGGITVYGSVAHELAYLGVPTIGCSQNPHVSFSFCRVAKTKEEYCRLIKDIDKVHLNSKIAKEESLMFYYMHFLNHSKLESEFLDLLGEWFNESHSKTHSPEKLIDILRSIKKSEGFQREVMALGEVLEA